MPQEDMYYKDSYRYGPKNQEVRALNRNSDLSGLRGYPSDREYMSKVRDSNLERDSARMSAEGSRAASRYKNRTTKKSSKRR
jgi:hypothetical protein